jgi:gliding motility-associated-like protein
MKGIILVLNSVLLLFSLFPDAAAQYNQTVGNGSPTAAVNFPGIGCTYKWSNNTPGIGLAASGAGNIASFIAVNTTGSQVTATITATPVPTGYAYIANSSPGSVSVVDTTTNMVVGNIALSSDAWGVSASPDGKFVYVTTSPDIVSVLNTATNTLASKIVVGSGPYGIAVSPDGSRLYVANSASNNVSVINTGTNSVVATVPVGSFPWGIAVSPDGSSVYVVNDYSNNVSVINTATNTVTTTITVGTNPGFVAVSPDGSRVYVTNSGANTVSVINTATHTIVTNIVVGLGLTGIAVSPDGNWLYVSTQTDNTGTNAVSVINAVTNAVVATIHVGNQVWGISVSPDGGRVYVACAGNISNSGGVVTNTASVWVINTAADTVISTIAVPSAPISIGNFISPGPGCNGSPVTFTITVDPVVRTVIAGTVTGAISACLGTVSASPNIQQFTVSGNNLSAGITVTAPPGFEVSLAPGSGYVTSLTVTLSGDSVGNTDVYVRSAASAPSGGIVGNVVIASVGAVSQEVAVTGTVNSQAAPSVTMIASANNICAGTAVTFTATPANGGLAPSYQWVVNGSDSGTNSASFSSNTLNNGDSVYCLMTGNLSCSGPVPSAAVYMVIYSLPVVTFNPDTVFITSNNGVQLSPAITGTIEKYQWSPADGLSNTDIDDPVASPGGISTYQLQVTTDNGCTATGKVTVIYERSLEMPNSFTPNGNGHNEVFRIPPGSQFYLEYFQIFDRWGGRVFNTQDISTGWDGTYNGVAANAGVFVYMIKGKTLAGEPVFLKGTVILIR